MMIKMFLATSFGDLPKLKVSVHLGQYAKKKNSVSYGGGSSTVGDPVLFE